MSSRNVIGAALLAACAGSALGQNDGPVEVYLAAVDAEGETRLMAVELRGEGGFYQAQLLSENFYPQTDVFLISGVGLPPTIPFDTSGFGALLMAGRTGEGVADWAVQTASIAGLETGEPRAYLKIGDIAGESQRVLGLSHPPDPGLLVPGGYPPQGIVDPHFVPGTGSWQIGLGADSETEAIGIVGFEDPSFGFEDPSFGFEDPSFGFEDPSFGFEDPSFGFEDPSFGFEDPSFGFEVPASLATVEGDRNGISGPIDAATASALGLGEVAGSLVLAVDPETAQATFLGIDAAEGNQAAAAELLSDHYATFEEMWFPTGVFGAGGVIVVAEPEDFLRKRPGRCKYLFEGVWHEATHPALRAPTDIAVVPNPDRLRDGLRSTRGSDANEGDVPIFLITDGEGESGAGALFVLDPLLGTLEPVFEMPEMTTMLTGVSVRINATAPVVEPCLPDLNGDGIVDNGDISTFVQLFLGGSLAADFNGDGFLDNGDIGAFVAAFLAGCP